MSPDAGQSESRSAGSDASIGYTAEHRAGRRLYAIVRDIHFWVPVAVLVAGLLVLRCIH